MSLSEILKTVEALIDAALSSGLIKDRNTGKAVLAAHDALVQKAAAEEAATAPALTVK